MTTESWSGLNIQWPISELIFCGDKTVETRTYALPTKYIRKQLLFIETPGRNGKFKARVVGIIQFARCFKYKSEVDFRKDAFRHKVEVGSDWDWSVENPKWAWEIERVTPFEYHFPAPVPRGIIFATKIQLSPNKLKRLLG